MRTLPIIFATALLVAVASPALAAFEKTEIAAVCQQTEGDLRDLIAASQAAKTGMNMAEEAGIDSEYDRWKIRNDKLYVEINTVSGIYTNFGCWKR